MKKQVPTPTRPGPVASVMYAPRAARHVGLDVEALRRRRARNKVARRSRRINRMRAK